MKRLLFIFLFIGSVVACENEKSGPGVDLSGEERTRVAFSQALEEYDDFDRATAAERLGAKSWLVEIEMEYGAEGEAPKIVWSPYCNLPEYVEYIELWEQASPYFPLNKTKGLNTWQYDPSNGVLTWRNIDFEVLALSEELLIWRYACEDLSGEVHHYYQLLRPKELEAFYAHRHNARTLLTCYAGMYDLYSHTYEPHYLAKAADRIIAAAQDFDPEIVKELLVRYPWQQALWCKKELTAEGQLEWIAEDSMDFITLWSAVVGHPWNQWEFLSDGNMSPISVGVPPETETLYRQWQYDPQTREIRLTKLNDEGEYEELETLSIVGIQPDLLIFSKESKSGVLTYEFCIPRLYTIDE